MKIKTTREILEEFGHFFGTYGIDKPNKKWIPLEELKKQRNKIIDEIFEEIEKMHYSFKRFGENEALQLFDYFFKLEELKKKLKRESK